MKKQFHQTYVLIPDCGGFEFRTMVRMFRMASSTAVTYLLGGGEIFVPHEPLDGWQFDSVPFRALTSAHDDSGLCGFRCGLPDAVYTAAVLAFQQIAARRVSAPSAPVAPAESMGGGSRKRSDTTRMHLQSVKKYKTHE